MKVEQYNFRFDDINIFFYKGIEFNVLLTVAFS